jgi:hypothetical protein
MTAERPVSLAQVKADWLRVQSEMAWVRMLVAARTYRKAVERKQAATRNQDPLVMASKYSPEQPRVPVGQSGGGQWTHGSGSDAVVVATENPSAIGGTGTDHLGAEAAFSPNSFGWHDYQAGPNQLCTARSDCSAREVADYAARYAYPGQDPSRPVEDRGVYLVFFPGTRIPAGYVKTFVSPDGLTITNVTKPLHLLYNGQIERTFRRTPEGTWQVVTHGNGNNILPGMNFFNQVFGPVIFNGIDEQLKNGVERHHGIGK